MVSDEEAMTLAEAAAALKVSPQRISQLLASGVLLGPLPTKGQRAPRNAPRVYRASLGELLAHREAISHSSRRSRNAGSVT